MDYYRAPHVRAVVWSSPNVFGKLSWNFSVHVNGRQVLYDNACVSQAQMMDEARARVETIRHLFIAHANSINIPEYPTEYGGFHTRDERN